VENRETLIPLVAEVMASKRCDEWMEVLVAAAIPCGPVNNMESLFNDPQVQHRGMIAEVAHPTIGSLRLTGVPVKYSATPGEVKLPPPLLGEHTDEILSSVLQYSPESIAALRTDEVVA
jgi:formyl-CoA transferase